MQKLIAPLTAGTVIVALSAIPALAFQKNELRSSDRIRTNLEREVRHELVMLPYYNVLDNLSFRVDGGPHRRRAAPIRKRPMRLGL